MLSIRMHLGAVCPSRARIQLYTKQALTSSSPSPFPVDLQYNAFVPPDGNEREGAFVILHGLFGSKRNWSTLAKAFSEEFKKPVYALDLRNQGESPHARPMTYSAMAEDVLQFIRHRSLTSISLVGHSMGGKAAMSVALHPWLADPANTAVLSNLIVEDIAPTRAKLSAESQLYIKTMKKIEHLKLKSRKQATEVLEECAQDAVVRSFLLTNLHPIKVENPYAKFRVPLDILEDAIDEIGHFPYAPGERSWGGRVQFIRGTRSQYINEHEIPTLRSFFPNMQLDHIDAGHWVHEEKPNEFKKLVIDFIRKPDFYCTEKI